MRTSARGLAVGCCLLALALGACQKPAPQAAAPKRHSFEDGNTWQPSAPVAAAPVAAPAGAPSGGNVGSTPQSIQQGWQQVEQAKGDAAKQQAAGEMLNRTQAMADQPAASSSPH
jgi:hypothetical protein